MTDRDEIQQLMAAYTHCLDSKDYAGIATCLAAGARFAHAGGAAVLGRAAITDFLRSVIDPLQATQHLLTNFLIATDGDHATLKCDVLAQHLRSEAAGTSRFTAGGKYEIELLREDSSWKIAGLSTRLIWTDGDASVVSRSA